MNRLAPLNRVAPGAAMEVAPMELENLQGDKRKKSFILNGILQTYLIGFSAITIYFSSM